MLPSAPRPRICPASVALAGAASSSVGTHLPLTRAVASGVRLGVASGGGHRVHSDSLWSPHPLSVPGTTCQLGVLAEKRWAQECPWGVTCRTCTSPAQSMRQLHR